MRAAPCTPSLSTVVRACGVSRVQHAAELGPVALASRAAGRTRGVWACLPVCVPAGCPCPSPPCRACSYRAQAWGGCAVRFVSAHTAAGWDWLRCWACAAHAVYLRSNSHTSCDQPGVGQPLRARPRGPPLPRTVAAPPPAAAAPCWASCAARKLSRHCPSLQRAPLSAAPRRWPGWAVKRRATSSATSCLWPRLS